MESYQRQESGSNGFLIASLYLKHSQPQIHLLLPLTTCQQTEKPNKKSLILLSTIDVWTVAVATIDSWNVESELDANPHNVFIFGSLIMTMRSIQATINTKNRFSIDCWFVSRINPCLLSPPFQGAIHSKGIFIIHEYNFAA